MKMYIVNGEVFNSIDDAVDSIFDNLDSEVYDEMLDEVYGDVEVCGYKYGAARTLKEIDPTAYRCGMLDYYDTLAEDAWQEIYRLKDGESADILGFEVRVEGSDDD